MHHLEAGLPATASDSQYTVVVLSEAEIRARSLWKVWERLCVIIGCSVIHVFWMA